MLSWSGSRRVVGERASFEWTQCRTKAHVLVQAPARRGLCDKARREIRNRAAVVLAAAPRGGAGSGPGAFAPGWAYAPWVADFL